MNVIIFSFLFFLNPFIFGRVFWGSDVITLTLIICSIGTVIWRLNAGWYFSKTKLALFCSVTIYFLFSSYVRVSIGQDYGDLFFHIYQYFSVTLLFFIRLDEKTIEIIFKSILFALGLHLWTVLPFLPLQEFLSERLSMYTAYPIGEYNIGGLTRRATGFFNSPGYLSLLCSCTLFFAVLRCKVKFDVLSILIVVFSLIVGFTTFSRSFFVVFLMVVIYLFLYYKTAHKIFVLLFLGMFSLYFMTSTVYLDYIGFVGERLVSSTDISSNDRITGDTGISIAFESISNNPFFGSAIAPDGGDIKSNLNGRIIRPHLGIFALMSFYGILLSLFLLFPFFISFFKSAFKLVVSGNSKSINYYHLPFFAAFFTVFIVCLVEPLIDNNLSLFFMIMTLLLNNRSLSKDFK